MDAAFGDRHPGDNVLGTFNPLSHIKPSVTVKPVPNLSIMAVRGALRPT